jgi:O-antigen/teichoic acid export membrane protein
MKKFLLSSPALTVARYMGSAASFVLQILLARLLPPEGLGTYFTVTSLAAVLGLLSAQGFPSLFQRFFARYWQGGRPELFLAFLARTDRQTLKGLSLTVPLAGLFVLFYFSRHGLAAEQVSLAVIAVALAVIASAMIYVNAPLAAIERRFGLSMLLDNLLRPALLLAIVLTAAKFGHALSVSLVLAIFAALSLGLALIQLKLVRPQFKTVDAKPDPRLARLWGHEARPMLLTSILAAMFVDVVILVTSFFLPPDGMGPFGTSFKLALLAAFAIHVSNQTALPDISDALRTGSETDLRKALRKAALFPAVTLSAALLVFVFAAPYVMGLYGESYKAAAPVLVMLVAAQLVPVLCGPAQQMLTLNGSQKANAVIGLGVCAVLIAANAMLVPAYGVMGAGLAAVMAIAGWPLASAIYLWRRHGQRSDMVNTFMSPAVAAA